MTIFLACISCLLLHEILSGSAVHISISGHVSLSTWQRVVSRRIWSIQSLEHFPVIRRLSLCRGSCYGEYLNLDHSKIFYSPQLEGQGLPVLDRECTEEPSTDMVGVATSRGVTSRRRANDRRVSVCRCTEVARRSRWLAAGLPVLDT